MRDLLTQRVTEAERELPAARPRRTGSPVDSASEPGPGGGSSLCLTVDEHVPFVTLAGALAKAGLRIVNDGRGGLVVREAS